MTTITITMELDEVLDHVEMLMKKDNKFLHDECVIQMSEALKAVDKAKNENGDIRHSLLLLDLCRLNLAILDKRLETRFQTIKDLQHYKEHDGDIEERNNEIEKSIPNLEETKEVVDGLLESLK